MTYSYILPSTSSATMGRRAMPGVTFLKECRHMASKHKRECSHPAMEEASGRHVSNSQIRCLQCGAPDVIPSHALASSACGRSTTVSRTTAPEYNPRMFRIPTIGNPRGSRRRARVESRWMRGARGVARFGIGAPSWAGLGTRGLVGGWLASLARAIPFLSSRSRKSLTAWRMLDPHQAIGEAFPTTHPPRS